MKYAIKYRLVPIMDDDKTRKLNTLENPYPDKVKELKQSMSNIIRNKPKNKKSALEMSHLLHEFLHYKGKKPYNKFQFLQHIPTIYHNKIQQLVHDASINWNEKGELKTNFGKPVLGSNISDLVQEARVRGKQTQPHGWNVFIKQLISSTLPIGFFTKSHVKKQIIEGRHIDKPDVMSPIKRWEKY